VLVTVIASERVLSAVCTDCYLTHKEVRAWPLTGYKPRGRSRGVLVPRVERFHAPSTPTIGVFENNQSLELVWQETFGTALYAAIGPCGASLRQAIALRTIEYLSGDLDYSYSVYVNNERLSIRIKKMAAEIIVTISPTGDTKVEVEGGSGGSCTNLTKGLEEALGKTTEQTYKPEFYNKPQDQRIQTRL
jgi:hypothetical protein